MKSLLHFILIPLILVLAFPVAAQKTSPTQDYARPGESTEPPRPHAAPVPVVTQHALPRAGGVLVFGGAGGVGLDLVKVLTGLGEKVTVATTVAWDVSALDEAKVRIVQNDLRDPEKVKEVFASAPFRAVVLAIGTGSGEAMDYIAGNKRIIDVAEEVGLPRVILVSAIGAGDSAAALPWYAKVMAWFGRKDLDAKTATEEYLRSKGLEYTVVRSGGVFSGPAGDTALLTSDPSVYGQIARTDLARLIAGCVDDDLSIGKTFSAIDHERSGLLGLLGMS